MGAPCRRKSSRASEAKPGLPAAPMRPGGFEPPTNGLEGRRSSTELRARSDKRTARVSTRSRRGTPFATTTEGAQMAGKLDGKRVAILAADMFERVELEEPRKALEEAGATIEVISIHDGEIQGFDHFDPATSVKVDRTVEEISPDDYDALMI